jgi:precorrin-8X/cobalt-precorrin-8 methylmutase
MPLFDRYIAVDWSAANTPRRGRDSIWIADSRSESINPSTRHEAMAILSGRLLAAGAAGERVMLGFDFVFGYPEGAAKAIVGAGSGLWSDLWATLHHLVIDNPDNSSNRFHVAASINQRLASPHYWGHPHQHRYDHLNPRRPAAYATIPERRRAEAFARTAQPVWKLTGVGSVGSQSMLGIARLEALRRHPALGADIAIWPFETAFADALARPITIVEIYPSLFPLDDGAVTPRDRAQVETCIRRFAALDAAGELGSFLSAPADLGVAEREILLREEGWIAGLGHATLARAAT